MNSAPHLLTEDRREYERILDEALRAQRQDLTMAGGALTAGQLRTMALDATALITAAAAVEYQHYVRARSELRAPARATRAPRPAGVRRGAGQDRGALGDFTRAGAEPGEPASAGLTAVLAVLAPLLAGAAALIFLLVGYALKLVGPEPAFAQTLRTTGWVFAAITAAAISFATAGLLLTALRNGSTSLRAADRDQLDENVRRTREAWHRALLERGIRPFLQEALQERRPAVAGEAEHAAVEHTGRMPHLGYHRPGFSSPESGTTAARPRYSSPDFTSPDYGGPEHQPE
ncbi:hypothetical protein [Streptomyces sp. TS71-3]|uniref:hypothetical protein n=1 Tax=Streptomyces sp. TS71-3 TaxID=2733862 RepID=UPI001BB34B8B|nr:hypothetical protein [Streptomyces sp. TS71-3]